MTESGVFHIAMLLFTLWLFLARKFKWAFKLPVGWRLLLLMLTCASAISQVFKYPTSPSAWFVFIVVLWIVLTHPWDVLMSKDGEGKKDEPGGAE